VTAGLWSARRLLLTISSQSASTFANQMVAFVIPWLVLSRTGSALNAGGVAFATGTASVPRVAREDDVPLVRASSLQETLQNTALFIGPLPPGC
jgi:hypothetical protein